MNVTARIDANDVTGSSGTAPLTTGEEVSLCFAATPLPPVALAAATPAIPAVDMLKVAFEPGTEDEDVEARGRADVEETTAPVGLT